MKKVKLKSSWCSDENILKRLLTQFKTSEDDLKNIIFVDDNSEEIVIFFGYITEELKDDKKYYVFPQEPSWSGNHQKSFPNDKDITLYGYDTKLYNFNGDIVESVSMMFYGGRGPESEGWDDWTYDNIKNNRPKSKKISSCVSSLGDNLDVVNDGCLYKKRVKLVRELINKTNFIDIYSWDLGNENTKGWLSKKIDGIVDYKFSLCIENSSEKNYLTEKFYDCILNDTIPIYYGCPNIKELLPENGYILIDNLDDIDNIIELMIDINQNCDEIYNRMIPNCRKIKEKFFNDYNPLKLINKLCE